jgi:hypothetical protein
MNYSQLEEYIDQLYSSAAIRTPEKINMFDIAQKLDIRLYLWDESSESSHYKGVYRIFLDKRLETCKQWREFAHQLCCVLKKAGDQLEAPPLYPELNQTSSNHFIFHFCVPTFMLKRLSHMFPRCLM